jgi:hypothetical protein
LIALIFASVIQLPAGNKEETAAPLWEKQMQYAMNDNPTGLKLTGYSYKGRITSERKLKKVIRKMFDYEADIPIENQDGLVFVKMKETMTSLTATGGYKDNVVRILKVGMGFVKVTWSYKGKEYKSIAVVSDDKGVIYDPIGFSIITKK